MEKWYVHTMKFPGIDKSKYVPRSLQLDINDIMFRLFHYRGMFFVYVFRGEDMLDLEITLAKQEALDFINNKIAS